MSCDALNTSVFPLKTMPTIRENVKIQHLVQSTFNELTVLTDTHLAEYWKKFTEMREAKHLKMLSYAQDGNIHKVDQFLNNGADVNYADQCGETLLMKALPYPNLVARILSRSNVNLESVDYLNNTALYLAVRFGVIESVTKLLNAGSSPLAVLNAEDFREECFNPAIVALLKDTQLHKK